MFPITSYRITPNLFGKPRWQAEIDGQRSRFARRAYSEYGASRKISRDENALYDGKTRLMQTPFIPATIPIRRLHDKWCRRAELIRRGIS